MTPASHVLDWKGPLFILGVMRWNQPRVVPKKQNTSKPTHQGPKGPLGATSGPSELMNVNYFLLQCMTSSKKDPPKATEKRQEKNKFHLESASHVGQAKPNGHIVPKQLPWRKTSDWACIVATWWLNRWEYGAEVCCQFSFYIILCAAVTILTIICH